MSQDPYKPPNSEVQGKGRSNPPPPSAAWRVFFGFNCLLITLNILVVPFIEDIGLFEVIDFTFTNITFAGLYGFIFLKAIGSYVFWRYFFYAAILESFIVFIVFPVFSLPLYGQLQSLDVWYLFNIVNTFFNLMAVNLYAFKYRSIWLND